jgi:hypothetical protein
MQARQRYVLGALQATGIRRPGNSLAQRADFAANAVQASIRRLIAFAEMRLPFKRDLRAGR